MPTQKRSCDRRCDDLWTMRGEEVGVIISATGHRPNKLGGYTTDATNRLYNVALAYLAAHRPDKVITGMALGWDQAVGWAASDLRIPFVAAIPFTGQEKIWNSTDQQWYNDLLRNAEEVVVVSEGSYAPWKMQVRNKWMVDRADQILALWDGTDGGTANCVRYAESIGKPVVNVYSVYKAQLNDNIV